MFHNLKVDIIYYKTASDFEMEFNLCGCCRMRLLNDKTSDRKNLVHAVARAVSRSRIILIVGPLFSQEGTIETIARAIKANLKNVDASEYGISAGDNIEIIEGSTPLITTERIFGGCIIEHGNQTMILVSDNKGVRKNIMDNLIHPYIEELNANEMKNYVPINKQNEEKIEENEDTIDTEEILTENNTVDIQTNVPEIVTLADIAAENLAKSIEENTDEAVSIPESDESVTESAEEANGSDDIENSIFIPPVFEIDGEDDVIISGGMDFSSDDISLKISPIEIPEASNEQLPKITFIDDVTEDEPQAVEIIEIEPEKPKAQELPTEQEESSSPNIPFYNLLDEEPVIEDTEEFKAKPKKQKKDKKEKYKYDDFTAENDTDSAEKPNRKSSKISTSILIVMAVVLLALVLLTVSIFYLPQQSGMTPVEIVRQTFIALFKK